MNATDLYFLNDVQYAFLIGRQSNAELCQVSCHVLIQYHAKSIDVERFRAAWQALAARHIVLRKGNCTICKREFFQMVQFPLRSTILRILFFCIRTLPENQIRKHVEKLILHSWKAD